MAKFDQAELDNLERRELHLSVLAAVFVIALAGGAALLMYPVVFVHPDEGKQMDAPDRVCRLLRVDAAFRGVPVRPAADRTEIEATSRGRAEAQYGSAESGERGFASRAAGFEPFPRPARNGIPARIERATAAFAGDRKGDAFLSYFR